MELRLIPLTEKSKRRPKHKKLVKKEFDNKKVGFIQATKNQFEKMWTETIKPKMLGQDHRGLKEKNLEDISSFILDQLQKNLSQKKLWWHESGPYDSMPEVDPKSWTVWRRC